MVNFQKDPTSTLLFPPSPIPTLAPPGKHVMSCFVQYAPLQYQGRTGALAEAEQTNSVMRCKNTIKEYVPDIDSLVEHRQVITPMGFAGNLSGLTEGNIFQGELTLEQLAIPTAHCGLCQSIKPR